MIPMISTLVALVLFPNQYECMHRLDIEVINRPEHSTFKYVGRKTIMVNLHGASAFLKCENSIYTVHVVESTKPSDFLL